MRLLIPGKDERGDPALHAAICDEIATAGGAIPFARFMDLCLQHPTRGYYRRGRTRAGHGGDFLTSPEAHPAFAGCMARQLEALGDALRAVLGKAGDPPVWVEAGAGTGTLSNLVAAALGNGASIVALDTAAHLHRPDDPEQTAPRRLRAAGLPFATGSITGGIYANELLDAFPVHRLRRTGAGWRELFVGIDGESFRWTEAEPGPAVVAEATRGLARGARVVEGQLVEVNPGIEGWLREAARVIGRGFVLLADYGDDTPRLWSAARPEGTLRCFAGHAVHDDPLRFAGTQDITAHVDFGAVAAHARDAGFEVVAFLDQRTWLDDWGVERAKAGLFARADAGTLRRDEAETNVHAIDFLRDAKGLGRVKLICFAKGVPPTAIPGLTVEVPEARRFTAADLPLTRLFDPFADLMG